MTAAIVTIGDEILIGQIVNSNSTWIGAELTTVGVSVELSLSVGDVREDILAALELVVPRFEITIVTGGLGPTHDDITRECVAEFFGVKLVPDDSILEVVRKRFESRGIEMPPSNHSQALVPQGFEAIVNAAGSAPALVLDQPQRLFVVLPGVPHEMKLFMTSHVLPSLKLRGGLVERAQKTLMVVGIGESSLQQKLEGLEHFLDEARKLAFLPNLLALRLRITTTGPESMERLLEFESWIRDRASDWIYGENDETLEEAVGRLFSQSNNTLAVAESCTGGFIAHTITNVPGSSAYFLGGITAYSNQAKESQLGVGAATLESFGAVSKQTACEMADGVRRAFGATVGISTTGILGPGGGTAERPVGTVWLAISTEQKTLAIKQQFGIDRLRNKERVLSAALNLLRRWLLNLEA
ncbi:MAG: competence/damage-inducible protein A [Bacteroidetes bacterium]|nr:competence/damage-inducible protein A [Bacteroidota bacterium]